MESPGRENEVSQGLVAEPSDHNWNVILNEGERKGKEGKLGGSFLHVWIIKKLSKGVKITYINKTVQIIFGFCSKELQAT